jgi:hypothetical protein
LSNGLVNARAARCVLAAARLSLAFSFRRILAVSFRSAFSSGVSKGALTIGREEKRREVY